MRLNRYLGIPQSPGSLFMDNVQILKLVHGLEDPMREVMYLRLVNLYFRADWGKSWGAARTGAKNCGRERESRRRQGKL